MANKSPSLFMINVVNKYDTIIDYTVRLTPFHQVSICCDKSTQIICTFIICLAVYTSHFLYDILD